MSTGHPNPRLWDEMKAELPPLPNKGRVSFALGRQSWLFVPYDVAPPDVVEVEIPFELSYKIFSRLCWQGTRIGLQHELGFDGKCDWCDTQIPLEVLYPDVNSGGKPVVGDEALLASFTNQGIPINVSSFEKLLQSSHIVNSFQSYRAPLPIDAGMVLKNVGDVSPPPVQEWNIRVSNAINRLSTIKADASKAEIGDAVQDIAEAVGLAELVVRKRIGEDAYTVLSQMFQESSISVLEQVKAYFILPIQESRNVTCKWL